MLQIEIVDTISARVRYRVTNAEGEGSGFPLPECNLHICLTVSGRSTMDWVALDDVGKIVAQAPTRARCRALGRMYLEALVVADEMRTQRLVAAIAAGDERGAPLCS